MTVQNNLSQRVNTATVEFQANGEKVKLSPQIVRNYLVNGNGNITDQEVVYFINLCKSQGLNPFIKDCYLIKYGDSQPAQMVVSKDVFLKRAERNEQYDGSEAGVIVLSQDGEVIYRKGSFYLKDREELVGGWADVYKKDITHPMHVEVAFDEYAGRTKTGALNSQWASKGGTMIRKVALTQALRETFPNDFQQLYGEEEMNVNIPLNSEPMQQPQIQAQPQVQHEQATDTVEEVNLV